MAEAFQTDAFQSDAFEVADAVTGTATQTLASLTQDAAADVITVFTLRKAAGGSDLRGGDLLRGDAVVAPLIEGTIASVLPAFTQVVAGESDLAGTIASVLPALGQTAAGQAIVIGSVAQTLPALTQDATGTAGLAGSIASVLGALTQAVDGELQVAGTIASVLGTDVEVFQADTFQQNAVQSVALLFQHATGGLQEAAAIASVLPALSQSAAGASDTGAKDAVILSVLPTLGQDVAGDALVLAVIVSVFPALGQSASMLLQDDGAIDSVLPRLEQRAGGGPARIRAVQWHIGRPRSKWKVGAPR
jgi:hypothetical protein